jgi:quercetin dioxygenase-like cupin family protein
VYVVLSGELTLTAGGRSEVLRPGDSVHLPQGTVRSVVNRGTGPAELLVIIAHAPEVTR